MRPAPSHRVLLVTPGFPADEHDSLCFPPVQLMLRDIYNRHPGLEIVALALHYPPTKRKYLWHTMEVHSLGRANHRWPLRFFDLARARRLAKQCHNERPFTHVHAFWLSDAALVATFLAKSWSIPASITSMGQDVLSTNLYLRYLGNSPARMVAISDRAGKILEQSIARPIDAVIPWGIEPSPDPLPEWQQRPIDLLGVGSLIELKEWTRLLEVTQHLSKCGVPCRTVLVGDGPLRAALENEAVQRGIDDDLTFTGELPRPEVLQLMKNSRILVHPSRFEGQGFVFAEALSLGMSIVSGPVGMALRSPRWRVTQPENFPAACSDLLHAPPSAAGLVINPLRETTAAYAGLWGIDR